VKPAKNLKFKQKNVNIAYFKNKPATEVTQNEKTLAIISVYFYQHIVWMRWSQNGEGAL